jgi:hypothetical protein
MWTRGTLGSCGICTQVDRATRSGKLNRSRKSHELTLEAVLDACFLMRLRGNGLTPKTYDAGFSLWML